MNKSELKDLISKAGVRQWQLAEKLGIREDALSRKLRHELSPDDEKSIKEAIMMIERERKE